MRRNVPAVDNKPEVLLTFWIDCIQNELTPPVLLRDKAFTMHTGLSQQHTALCPCKMNTASGKSNTILSSTFISSFFRFYRDFKSFLFGRWDEVIFLYYCVKGHLNLYAAERGMSHSARSKPHLWALLYIELPSNAHKFSLSAVSPFGQRVN